MVGALCMCSVCFTVFAFFAKQIGKLFFVAQDSRAQIIKVRTPVEAAVTPVAKTPPDAPPVHLPRTQAFSVYAGGFLVRPLGSLLFGMIGDHYGTARALQVSIFAMAIPTFLVGLLPTYAQIGLAAPALLTALRLLQGLCGTSIPWTKARATSALAPRAISAGGTTAPPEGPVV